MNGAWSRRAVLRAGAGAFLAACAGAGGAAVSVESDGRPNSPLAANPQQGVWPDQIAKASAEVREAYTYAAGQPKSLSYIPCYCGCGAQGHKNNLDCYVKTFSTNGWIVVDLHGYG